MRTAPMPNQFYEGEWGLWGWDLSSGSCSLPHAKMVFLLRFYGTLINLTNAGGEDEDNSAGERRCHTFPTRISAISAACDPPFRSRVFKARGGLPGEAAVYSTA